MKLINWFRKEKEVHLCKDCKFVNFLDSGNPLCYNELTAIKKFYPAEGFTIIYRSIDWVRQNQFKGGYNTKCRWFEPKEGK